MADVPGTLSTDEQLSVEDFVRGLPFLASAVEAEHYPPGLAPSLRGAADKIAGLAALLRDAIPYIRHDGSPDAERLIARIDAALGEKPATATESREDCDGQNHTWPRR